MSKRPTQKIHLGDEALILHPSKIVFWERKGTLICADIHAGKGAHFRNNGISVPRMLNKNNFWKLSGVIEDYQPETLLVLGDMMHSVENTEWDDFWDFLDNYSGLKRVLVRGNHELYQDSVYEEHGFSVHSELVHDGFTFTHEPMQDIPENTYNLCGHIHPAIRLSGSAKQNLRIACFWFGKNQGILPAFGEFTGTHAIRPKRGDQVFAVSNNEVIEIKEVRTRTEQT